jgi:hypothetical protein
MKRAFLLTMDAIVAVGLLFLLAAFVSSLAISYSSPELEYQRLYYGGKDLMNVFETAKFSAVADIMPENFTANCNITSDDMNKTILDVIGYLWAQNSTILTSCAENISIEVLNRTLPKGLEYEILMDDVSIYSTGTGGDYISRLSTIVSGYELGKPVSGYFASAFISRISKSTSSYAYFGGYVGDGNITKRIIIPQDANVTEAYMELTAGNNFTLFVNGNNEGIFYPSVFNMTPSNWTLCDSYAHCTNFTQGENTIDIVFETPLENYIGGGFLKITYNTSKPDTLPFSLSNESAEKFYNFTGIDGVIIFIHHFMSQETWVQ